MGDWELIWSPPVGSRKLDIKQIGHGLGLRARGRGALPRMHRSWALSPTLQTDRSLYIMSWDKEKEGVRHGGICL